MTDSDILSAVCLISPRTAQRARCMAYAVNLLTQGMPRRSVTRLIRERYGVGQVSAWRLVDMAADVAILEPRK